MPESTMKHIAVKHVSSAQNPRDFLCPLPMSHPAQIYLLAQSRELNKSIDTGWAVFASNPAVEQSDPNGSVRCGSV